MCPKRWCQSIESSLRQGKEEEEDTEERGTAAGKARETEGEVGERKTSLRKDKRLVTVAEKVKPGNNT